MIDVQQRIAELRVTLRCGDFPGGSTDTVDGLIELIEATQPKKVLEIGSGRGVSTEVFLLHCEHVVSVDPYDFFPERRHYDIELSPGWRADFENRCCGYQNLTVVRDFSPDALLKMVPQYFGYFDLLYVDGNHEYQQVFDDVRAGWHLVCEDGWLAGHDYLTPGNDHNVIAAVDAMFGKENLTIFSDTSWLIRRPKQQPGDSA